VRLAVHASAHAAGGRLPHALDGLAARGHELTLAGGGMAGPARTEADVVVGGSRPLGATWLAAMTRARAVVLELDARSHRAWGPLDRWAWSVAGAYGLIDERQVAEFLARSPAEERERVALWPPASAPSPASGAPAGEASTHADTQLLERCCERALARRSAGPGRSALFVDRDGTLIAERHHLADPAGVQLLPGVAEALRGVRAMGHPVVVVSNQAGVGRGQFPETVVHAVMGRLRRLLRAEGVELDAVRHCPHAPEAGCDCRKPGARLLREAAEDLRLSLRDSVMVGDKWIDVEAGQAAGAAGVLVRTGHGIAELSLERGAGQRAADLVCDDLPAAARWFLARQA
jgi:histidinol-phosphate phosphatase family protein